MDHPRYLLDHPDPNKVKYVIKLSSIGEVADPRSSY